MVKIKPVFDHERLDVYCVSLEFARWAYLLCSRLKGMNRHARDQLLRASQSVPLNIAEGNGKRTTPDRRRFFLIANGSALECAAILDTLLVCDAISKAENAEGKTLLVRIVSMLTKMTGDTAYIREESEEYDYSKIENV